MMSSKTAEIGFVVELPCELNHHRLIIVAAGDTVQCYPTREQRQVALGESVLFEESSLHQTVPRTVVIKDIGVSTDVAKFLPDPEDDTLFFETKVKSILPVQKNGKRLLKTNFFKSVPELEVMRNLKSNMLIGALLKMRKVNFARYEITDFQLPAVHEKRTGIVYRKRGSTLNIYSPGFPEDFHMDISHLTIDDDFVGKWISFFTLADMRTVDVSKEVSPFSEDPFVTRDDGSSAQIMMKCFLHKSSIFTEDFEEQIYDYHHVLEKYDLREFDGRLWIQCLADESTNSFALVVAKVQEQLGQPRPIPARPVDDSHPVLQPVRELPPEEPPRARRNQDSKRSRDVHPHRNQREQSIREDYTFVKAGRKHNPDGSVALLHVEKGESSDRPSRSASSRSASSSDGPTDVDYAEENRELKKQMKKMQEQLEKITLDHSKRGRTIRSINDDNTLLRSSLETTRRDKERGQYALELLKKAMVKYPTREFLTRYDRKLAEELEDVVFSKTFTPRY